GDAEPRRLERHPDPGRAGIHEGPSAGAPLPRRPPADDCGRNVANPAARHRPGHDPRRDQLLVMLDECINLRHTAKARVDYANDTRYRRGNSRTSDGIRRWYE